MFYKPKHQNSRTNVSGAVIKIFAFKTLKGIADLFISIIDITLTYSAEDS